MLLGLSLKFALNPERPERSPYGLMIPPQMVVIVSHCHTRQKSPPDVICVSCAIITSTPSNTESQAYSTPEITVQRSEIRRQRSETRGRRSKVKGRRSRGLCRILSLG